MSCPLRIILCKDWGIYEGEIDLAEHLMFAVAEVLPCQDKLEIVA